MNGVWVWTMATSMLGIATSASAGAPPTQTAANTQRCDQHAPCDPLMVYATPKALGKCDVTMKIHWLEVSGPADVRLTWRIDKPVNTVRLFRITAVAILNLPDAFDGGSEDNEPDADPVLRPETGRAGYGWTRRARSGPGVQTRHNYEVWVERRTGLGHRWSPCGKLDPVIINQN